MSIKQLIRRLARLEAALPPVVSVVDRETLRMKVRFMAELAGQGPKESPAEAIARLLGIAPGRVLASLRSGEFFARWDELIRPLRGLEGPALIEACEAMRARNQA